MKQRPSSIIDYRLIIENGTKTTSLQFGQTEVDVRSALGSPIRDQDEKNYYPEGIRRRLDYEPGISLYFDNQRLCEAEFQSDPFYKTGSFKGSVFLDTADQFELSQKLKIGNGFTAVRKIVDDLERKLKEKYGYCQIEYGPPFAPAAYHVHVNDDHAAIVLTVCEQYDTNVKTPHGEIPTDTRIRGAFGSHCIQYALYFKRKKLWSVGIEALKYCIYYETKPAGYRP